VAFYKAADSTTSSSVVLMNCRIYRGAKEVGGSCVELETQGFRILLDLGLPLSAATGDQVPLPPVAGLAERGDPGLLGIVVSHGHPDHYGRMREVSRQVPIYMGAATERILRETAFYTPMGLDVGSAAHLVHREPLQIGPFTITPFLTDHSAFDAYGLLVEADGRRLYYSGDLRGHGRKAGLFEEFLRNPPGSIDVLLLEGTHLRESADATDYGQTEKDVENACVATIRATEGIVLALFSPQNVDRLVTFYRAAVRSDRELVIDLYTAAIARATGRATIPQAEWERVHVYLPRSQRSRVIREQAFHRTDAIRPHRIFPEELRARRNKLVILFRASMVRELESAGCLDGAGAIWSMWPGYLHDPSGQRLRDWLLSVGVPMVVHHSSGHGHIRDLQRLVAALAPSRVVPIHTFAPQRFEEFFPRVQRQQDLESWEV
jgi:ribonuclease J